MFALVGLLALQVGSPNDDRDTPPLPSERHVTLTEDGAWCWFSDPRAVRFVGKRDRTYVGWATSEGSIVVGAIDNQTGRIESTIIQERLSRDDHINPSLLFLSDGTLLVFYSKHSADAEMRLAVSRRPEDISNWRPSVRMRPNLGPEGESRDGAVCYSNPVRLEGEADRLYLFWRGIGSKPCVATSDDSGQSWSPGRVVVAPATTYPGQRPYLKVDSNGLDRIHLAFTDGHPRNEPTNGIHYACFRDRQFRKADGSIISDWAKLPFDSRAADIVYDGRATGVRAWVWDVAHDRDDRPVIVYSRLPAEEDHRYHYARWDGHRWRDTELASAGRWFPTTPEGQTEREPHYSGGLVLDHDDPSTVYLSIPRSGRFEVERWSTPDLGATWRQTPITSGSARDNVRPVAVRGAAGGKGPRVLWMEVARYRHYTDYLTGLKYQ